MTTTETKPMLAFHGDTSLKEKYVARVKAHRVADEIISGKYWENGKGCAVGCTIHGGNHAAYENEIGIPRVLARLEDRLFEAIYSFAHEVAKEWPLRFITAAKEGTDLSLVWSKFAHWMLVDPVTGVIRHAKRERTKESIERVADLYLKWIETGIKPDFYAAAAAAFYRRYGYWPSYRYYRGYAAKYKDGQDRYLGMADKLIELMQSAI